MIRTKKFIDLIQLNNLNMTDFTNFPINITLSGPGSHLTACIPFLCNVDISFTYFLAFFNLTLLRV